jgi:pantoate--beta-alanine ligase
MSCGISTISDTASLRERIRSWRSNGESVGFVPTMGNLHEGHLALVAESKRRTQRCVVCIFVNPMQFGAGEDFECYPRTLEEDRQKLAAAGVDLLFAPTASTIYPAGTKSQTRVEVPEISDILCGVSRPRHFIGVATVVCKLFNMVQPDLAVFGEKDYQQLMVIRRMVTDLAIPIEIVGLNTVREEDGLAQSSRNGYLTPEERLIAPILYQTLRETAAVIADGNRDFARLEEEGWKALSSAGFRPDYFAIRSAKELAPARNQDSQWVILVAAYLGSTRLIDNLIAA